jgi:hypothetical protein
MKTYNSTLARAVLVLALSPGTHAFCQTKPAAANAVSPYFTVQPHPGDKLYYIGFRTVAISAPGLDRSLVDSSGSEAEMEVLPGSTALDLKMTISARIEGAFQAENAPYELRDHGDIECFQGDCHPERSSTAPVAKGSVWGLPTGPLHPGMTWTTDLDYTWEFGPPGNQTIRVISVEPKTGTVILVRDGNGDGPRSGAKDITTVIKGGKSYTVSIKRGRTHWSGKATIQHGMIVSDECLSDAEVVLSSREFGAVTGRERMFNAIMQYPEPFAY